MAGGTLALSTTAASAATATTTASSFTAGPRCVWIQKNGRVYLGHRKNKVTVTKYKHSPFHIKRERGCVKNRHWVY
ncbi:hypothetical protein [Nonomuraea sp. NPDC050310]